MPGTRGTAASAAAARTAGPETSSTWTPPGMARCTRSVPACAGELVDLRHRRPAEFPGQQRRHHLGGHIDRRVTGDNQVHVTDVPYRPGEHRRELGLAGPLRESSSTITVRSRPRDRAALAAMAAPTPVAPARHADQLGARRLGQTARQLDGHGIVRAEARLGPGPVHGAVRTDRGFLRVAGPFVGDHNLHSVPPGRGGRDPVRGPAAPRAPSIGLQAELLDHRAAVDDGLATLIRYPGPQLDDPLVITFLRHRRVGRNGVAEFDRRREL